MAMKVRFPDNVVLLRGNHETQGVTRVYGFFDEVKRRYKINLWSYKGVPKMSFSTLPSKKVAGNLILCGMDLKKSIVR